MRTLFSLLIASYLAAQDPQPFTLSAGFKLGAPINDPANQYSTNSKTQGRWTGGPSIELHLPKLFSLEFDALYRTSREQSSYAVSFDPKVNPYFTSSRQSTNTWDLPLLLKRRFQIGSWRPFLSAGYQWSRGVTKGWYQYSCAGPQGSCTPTEYPFPELYGGQIKHTDWQRGVVAGAGLDFKTRHGTISPEVRFNPKDQRVTGLVGFTFGKTK